MAEIKMRLSMISMVLSILLFVFVLMEDMLASSGFLYLALLSLIPFFYGILRGGRKWLLLFVLLLGLAYLPASLSYRLSLPNILKLSIIWPLFFALFAVLSLSRPEKIEKRALFTWLMSSAISSFTITGIFLMSSPVLNPFIVAAAGILAALAMFYLVYGEV